MTPVRELILTYIAETLKQIEGVKVTRDDPREQQQTPVIVLFDGGEEVNLERSDTHMLYRDMTFGIQAVVTAEPDEAVSTTWNTLYGQIISTLFADPYLGGLTEDMEQISMDVEAEEIKGHRVKGHIEIICVATYATQPHTLSYTEN